MSNEPTTKHIYKTKKPLIYFWKQKGHFYKKMFRFTNDFNIIHDKLQPLGLSSSETIISFNTAIDRQLPVSNIIDEE